jgi:hypothetical protein
MTDMNVWCEGCGEEAPLDPAEVEGRGVLMICEQCWRELREVSPNDGSAATP